VPAPRDEHGGIGHSYLVDTPWLAGLQPQTTMSNQALNWAWKQQVRGPAKAVLMNLADRANESAECWPSISTIARDTGIAKSTAKVALQTLREAGLISWKQRPSAKGGLTSSLYRLDLGQPGPCPGPGREATHPRPGDGQPWGVKPPMGGSGDGQKPSIESAPDPKEAVAYPVHVGGRRGRAPVRL
jgi:GntR family transcriptional regulator